MRRFTDNNSVIRKDSNTSSIVNQPYYKEKEEVFSTPKITFLFRNDETFGVEVYQNGGTEKLKNDGGNEWTPMYLSMVKGSPIIGESAKSDYRNFPNYVVYDILKVIGKPVHVINHMDPKPKNNITVKDEENCFVVKTPCAEDRHISEERIMAAFLKIQKEQVEKSLKTDIKSVFISTDFALTDFQKAVFLKAASKLKLEILSFALNY
uniref:Uncharacterized protein n=1 Tax=Panagrolaimus superbus TaxID=310955 RepID=A0A914Z646_9BILA